MAKQSQQHAIWSSMADHFLDTDTRPWIPGTALRCVETGLSTAEAGLIWRFEVTPAVWPNICGVAGVWTGFAEEWLFPEIERQRNRWLNQPGIIGELVYRMRAHAVHDTWLAIERTMELLRGEQEDRRSVLARDLRWLADCFFDFPFNPATIPAWSRTRFEREFLPVFAPLVESSKSLAICRARVENALDAALRATGRPCRW